MAGLKLLLYMEGNAGSGKRSLGVGLPYRYKGGSELNLTQITARIGSSLAGTYDLPFEPLPAVKAEKGEVPCSAKLVCDIGTKKLYFQIHAENKTEREL